MILQKLADKGLAKPPSWLPGNTSYLTIMGSVAYGVSSDTSDMDVYGFCVPRKDDVFPHLRGEILGFGKPISRFEQYQQHHIFDKDAMSGKGRVYDLNIFSIVKYFHLLMQNNPNVVDSIFTDHDCVLHSTEVGNMVRERRKMFLHKGAWPRLKGYSYSQISRLGLNNEENQDILDIRSFENDHGIPHETTLEDIENEIKRRKIVCT